MSCNNGKLHELNDNFNLSCFTSKVFFFLRKQIGPPNTLKLHIVGWLKEPAQYGVLSCLGYIRPQTAHVSEMYLMPKICHEDYKCLTKPSGFVRHLQSSINQQSLKNDPSQYNIKFWWCWTGAIFPTLWVGENILLARRILHWTGALSGAKPAIL